MPGLNNLQNSYMNSLKALTRTTGKKKTVEDPKKDDELTSWKNKNAFDTEKAYARQTFPLTNNMFFLSFVFWVAMTILIYLCVSYGMMYARITQESDIDGKCTDVFSPDKDENQKIVANYSIGEAGPYLRRLRPTPKEDYPMESNELPPIVTAITSAQFYQFQGLVSHIMEEIKSSQSDLKLIVYDLGLYAMERQLLHKHCHCEVRKLHFEQYPAHVATVSNNAWRPIILQLLVEEFGAVLYIEPTTRFKDPASTNYLRMRGSRNYFFWDSLVYTSLVAYTDRGMFDYLNEKRCAFQECALLNSEAIALYRTEITWNELMRPWLICALNADCIAPKHATYSGCFDIRRPRTTGCHRYDMSAVSIILNRGVQYTIDAQKLVSFRLTYTDEEEVSYFPNQPWTYTQILLLILIPILVIVCYKYLKHKRLCRF